MPSPDPISSTLPRAPLPDMEAGATRQAKGKEPVRSRLTNRVSTAPPNAPRRAGFLRSIGRAVANALSRLFSGPKTNVARIARSERRQFELQVSLRGVRDALLSPNATKDSIKDSLLTAEASARMLRKEDGSAAKWIQRTFQELFSKASPEEQGRIAIALRSPAVADALAELEHNDGAMQVLLGAEVALHAEITQSVEANVQKQIDAALNVMKERGPAARVEDHLRLAFAAAVPQVKPGSLEAGSKTQDEVHGTIVAYLSRLPAPARCGLLTHLSGHDLAALLVAARRVGEEGSAADIESEIRQRPERLAADLPARTNAFVASYGGEKAFDPKAFLRDLSAITRQAAAVDQHVAQFDTATSPPAGLADVKQSVVAVLQGAIASGKLDLNDLMAVEIRELMAAFDTLSAADVGTKLLANALGKMLQQCCANLEDSLHELGKELATGTDTASLLKKLNDAAEKAAQLNELRRTLGPAAKELHALTTPSGVAAQWFHNAPEKDKPLLVAALSGPHFKPLMADLYQAEMIALDAHETATATQFHQMADLLGDIREGIVSELDEPPANVDAPPPPHEPTRQALSQLYGINLSAKQATLNAGRFNTEQTEIVAQRVERPITAADLQPASVGGQVVTDAFRVDARRQTPHIWIANPDGTRTPLINHQNWPTEEQDGDCRERDARIAEGCRSLVQFCGIEEAQQLMVHLNQHIVDGLADACRRDDSPLHLDDGTVGSLMENPSGEGKVDIDVTVSKGANGHLQLEVSYRAEGRHNLMPADGGAPIPLSENSSVQMDFRAELNSNGSLSLLSTPAYRFSLERNSFPKHYPPPTVASLRAAEEGRAALNDTIIYAQSVRKDYQISALRAVDAFERQPTVQNAVAVITACDRGAEEAEGLISPEVRKKVQAAAENSNQGVLAALAHAESVARQLAQHRGDIAGVSPLAIFSATKFLEQLAALQHKSGTELLEGAEELYHEYIEAPEAGSGRPPGSTIPMESDDREEIGRRLAAQRQSLAQPAFAADLFAPLPDVLSKRIEQEVLPGMIDAVKRGDI